MFSCKSIFLVMGLLAANAPVLAQSAEKYPGVGRTATAKEVQAWDIDVRPDFKGLPAGSGSAAKGHEVLGHHVGQTQHEGGNGIDLFDCQ